MRLRLLLPLCVLLPLLLWQGVAHACQVCVVSSAKTQAFQEAFDSLGQEMERMGLQRNSVALLNVQAFQEGSSALQNARLVITLGTDALRQVSQRNTRLPVLAALVPRQSFERILSETGRRSASGTSALFLDQPLARQLELLRLALPQARRVGVLWGPESIAQQGAVSSALHTHGLELREATFGDGQNLSVALQAALQETDVLLQVADASVYNTATVSNVLLTSYRAKVPVLAYSAAYVKAGALLSVYSTAIQAGVQLAAMAAQVLQGGGLPLAQYPNDFTITVNDYVARSLGLKLDAKALTDTLQRGERRP
jgi:putative ABC transport system substrate-binding protein